MHSEQYKREYSKEFASRWDQLIGWDGREDAENGFFDRLLEANDCRRVADVAAGTGYHAIQLAQKSFDVVATDGSPNMVEQTRRNAAARGVELAELEVVDWRDLDARFGEGAFDAILCLGNAFTHLFDHDARLAAAEAMLRTLRPGGLLALDHRNYDRILDNGYSSKHRYYYTGTGVDARPVEISSERVRFEYTYPDRSKYHLSLYPLRRDYTTGLLEAVGFEDITRYGDFEAPFDPGDVDFIQQVARRPQ